MADEAAWGDDMADLDRPDDEPTMAEALAMVPDHFRHLLSWGDRGGGKNWQAAINGYVTTIGHGGPYPNAPLAIMQVGRLVRSAYGSEPA